MNSIRCSISQITKQIPKSTMLGKEKSQLGVSLVKSRDVLNTFAHRLANVQSNRQNSKIIESIQHSSQKAQHCIETKIEDNYNLILNKPTLMPFSLPQPLTLEQKQQNISTLLSPLEGAKSLMYKYWQQKNNKNGNTTKSTTLLSKTFESRKSDSKLPNIRPQQQEFKMGAYIRLREKNQELRIGYPVKQEIKEEYHIKIKIVNFKSQNESKPFLKFMKIYYKNWPEISSILKALQKFAEHYELTNINVFTSEIFQLIQRTRRGQHISPHDLLACCEDPEKISQENQDKEGIRFYGKAGAQRASVVIQSHIRKYLQVLRFRKKIKQWRSAKAIQTFYRLYKTRKQFKEKIEKSELQKIVKFNQIQKQFVQNYKRRKITERKRYEIHIPSHSWTDWQKVSISKFIEKQNAELCRMFKAAAQNPLSDVHIIYVSPVSLSKQILNYYFKLFHLASDAEIQQYLTIIAPEASSYLPTSLSLAQHLYYSPQALNKIKKMIGKSYAYIVPSSPSNDYIHLCHYLNIPLYSGFPQKLAYLQTRGGCKSFQQSIREGQAELLPILPYSADIYSQFSLLNELTNLVYCYPDVRRWVLKIDNECQSRGVAYIDVSKILGNKIDKLRFESKLGEKVVRQQIYSTFENSLVINKEERIIAVDKRAYRSQHEYLQYFYTRGGIIEASINNFQTELQNSCYCVDLEPTGQWNFLSSYQKVTNKHKALAAYFPDSSTSTQPPPLIIDTIVKQLKLQGLFGYFSFEFLGIDTKDSANQKQVIYLNSIKCGLDQYSSAHYLRNFISPQSNCLYVPILSHPALKQLRMQTFFHLCRLQNISFDIENKIGNIFTFIDSIEGGCIGIMTFNNQSKQNCFAHTAQVFDFLNSKVRVTGKENAEGGDFMSLKNAINGFLKRLKKKTRKPKC